MGKKRKSRGRSKGGKGRSNLVQCANCGALTPRDKAIKVEKPMSLVDAPLARELRRMGTFIPRVKTMKYMCVSCAIHNRVVKVRAKEQRRFGPGEFA